MSTQCRALTRWGLNGPLAEPRRCARKAKEAGLCALHRRAWCVVTMTLGGFCAWCGRPGNRYESNLSTLPIALCGGCAHALLQALRSSTPKRGAA